MSAGRQALGPCILCGAPGMEMHHVGGRNHVPWAVVPLCKSHHAQFHALGRSAEVDLSFTADPVEQLVRSLKLVLLLFWMIVERLHRAVRSSRSVPTHQNHKTIEEDHHDSKS